MKGSSRERGTTEEGDAGRGSGRRILPDETTRQGGMKDGRQRWKGAEDGDSERRIGSDKATGRVYCRANRRGGHHNDA